MNNKERIKASTILLIIAMLIGSHMTMYAIGKAVMHDEIADLEMKEGRILPAKLFNMTRNRD
jgi:hypothetical protein